MISFKISPNTKFEMCIRDRSNALIGTFCNCVNQVYNFFNASPLIWQELLKHIDGKSLHALSKTRWSARIHAVAKVTTEKLPDVIKSLK